MLLTHLDKKKRIPEPCALFLPFETRQGDALLTSEKKMQQHKMLLVQTIYGNVKKGTSDIEMALKSYFLVNNKPPSPRTQVFSMLRVISAYIVHEISKHQQQSTR